MIDLIYCAAGNKTFADIAIEAGYQYGAQLPNTIYHKPYFVDQDWRNPNREKYISALDRYRPFMASVMDWEYEQQLPEVLGWAEDAARYVETVMIIPKVHGGIEKLPRIIGGKQVRLGYSVPTRFAGTDVHVAEFSGWPVHLLGGSPGKQMELTNYLNVVSVDGNMHQRMATGRTCAFWIPGKRIYSNRWLSLAQADGKRWDGNGPQEAFRRSCVNIMAEWRQMYNGALVEATA